MPDKFGSRKSKASPSKFSGGNPEHGESVSSLTLTPVFSFDQMKTGTGYSIYDCEDEDRLALLTRMHKLSTVTWNQINQADRHGIGTEKINKKSIRPSTSYLSDDVKIIALRYKGFNPMLGYKEGRIFHILFLDHNFTCYDHS